MVLKIVFTAIILSTQLVPAHSSPEEKCLDTSIHKEFPSAEGSDFVACLPWKSRSCCSADTVKKLKSSGSGLHHNDWDYCGKMSQSCRKFLMKDACFYYCDPNLVKWRTGEGMISRVPVCSHTCDEWFEACKNDMTYSSNWKESYLEGKSREAPVKSKKTCRTFAEIFHNGEGLCNRLWGPRALKYETSPNCFVFDFKGENPNDKVTKT